MMFALRELMEKYRNGQKELSSVSVDVEKTYDRVPGTVVLREEVTSGREVCEGIAGHI